MIRIREANTGDLPQILDIYNHAIVYTTAVYDYEPHTLAMRKQWFATKQEQGLPVLVADNQGEVVGFCSLGAFRAWAAYQYTVENAVYVRDDQKGKGIGGLLMQQLIEAARKIKVHTIVAGIDADNPGSIHLHKKFGFTEVAHFREVGWKFDRWLDLKFLQLIL